MNPTLDQWRVYCAIVQMCIDTCETMDYLKAFMENERLRAEALKREWPELSSEVRECAVRNMARLK